jgi:hypothetical protein
MEVIVSQKNKGTIELYLEKEGKQIFLTDFYLAKIRFLNIEESLKKTLECAFNSPIKVKSKSLLMKYVNKKKEYLEKEIDKEVFADTLASHFFPELKEVASEYVERCYKHEVQKEIKKTSKAIYIEEIHCKDLHKIAFCMRFLIPLSIDYYSSINCNENLDDLYWKVFCKLYDYFNENEIVEKLESFIQSRIIPTYRTDFIIWKYFVNRAVSPANMKIEIFKRVTSAILYKLDVERFPVSFIDNTIKRQLEFKFRENFPVDYSPLSTTNSSEKEEEDLTTFDKLEVHFLRKDEGLVALREVNKENQIFSFIKNNNIEIDDKEFDFLLNNLEMNKFQTELVFLFYAKQMGTFDMYQVNRKFYVLMLMAMKEKIKELYPVLSKFLTCYVDKNFVFKDEVKFKRKDLLNKLLNTKIYNHLCTKYDQFEQKLGNEKNQIMKFISWIKSNKWYKDKARKEEEDINMDAALYQLIRFLNEYI